MTTGQIISIAILAILAFLALRAIRQLLRPGPAKRRPGKARGKAAHRKSGAKATGKIPGKTRPGKKPQAVIDGSNVMHWGDNSPRFAPISQVVRVLETRGYQAGVMFDANAGYKLAGRYMNDFEFGRHLGIGKDRIMVVPRGTQADPFLLRYASQAGAIVISNDRFRDWLAEFPDFAQPGRLVRGGSRDGKVWLDLPKH